MSLQCRDERLQYDIEFQVTIFFRFKVDEIFTHCTDESLQRRDVLISIYLLQADAHQIDFFYRLTSKLTSPHQSNLIYFTYR